MHLKIAIVCALFAVISASHIHHGHHDHHHHAHPYKFGYHTNDKEGSHYRHESGDGAGHVSGHYGYTDHKGLHREVHYVADGAGFRAEVKTNEPGTANQDPANVKVHSHAPHHHHDHHGHHGHHHGHHGHHHG